MARTQTTAQSNALASPRRREFTRVFVQDPDGVMVDRSSWFQSAELEYFDLDRPIAQMTFRFRREKGGTQSLSPLMTGSTVNRNAAAAYAPAIDVSRSLYFEVALLDPSVATTPAVGDWQRLFQGTIDTVDPAADDMVVVARDLGARLADTWLEEPTAMILEGAPTVPIQTLIQTMLDTALGAGQVTLYVPVAVGINVTRFGYQREPLFDAILRLAQSFALDCRYLWDSGTSSFRLTLYTPPRTKTTPDLTLAASRYKTIRKFAITRAPVRNKIKIYYTDFASRPAVTVNDSASQLRYGVRPLIIEEAGDSPINSSGEATTMANALLADLKDPRADQEVEGPLLWPAEGNDLVRFPGNGVHFDTNQDLAILGIRHSFPQKTMATTTLTLRGSPAGAYRAWIKRGAPTIGGTALPPVFWVSSKQQNISAEVVTLNGWAGEGAPTGSLQYRKRSTINSVVSAWSAYLGVTLPQDIVISRDPGYDTKTEFELLQADGQSTTQLHTTTAEYTSIDRATGRVRRIIPIDDGDYAARATNNTGLQLHANAIDATSREVRRAFAKTTYTDGDNLDYVPDGVSLRAVSQTAVDASYRPDLSKAGVVGKILVNLSRSAVDATPLSTIAGQLANTGHLATTMQDATGRESRRAFAKGTYTDGDTLDYVPDGATLKAVIGISGGYQITPTSSSGRSRCYLTASANLSVADGGTNTVFWDTESYDVGALHSLVTNTDRVTIPSGGNVGVWLLQVQIEWLGVTSGSAGSRQIRIVKNGATDIVRNRVVAITPNASGWATMHGCVAFDDQPSVGDFYQVIVDNNDAGGARSVVMGVGRSFFTVTHLW